MSPGGISTSPLSTTSTSGRSAASASVMSGGRATSQITAPGLHRVISITRCPNADVAVMIRSQSPMPVPAFVAMRTCAPGVSSWILRFRSINFSGSIDTSTTSRIAWAMNRAQIDAIDPVAPTTITLPRVRSVAPILMTACLAASSVAATVRLFPLVTAISASCATVMPASPTTLVNAPSPMMRAPRRSAMRAHLFSRL